MLTRLFVSILMLGFLSVPSYADMHFPTTPPVVRIDSMEVFWKRPDSHYIRLTFKLWNQATEDARPLTVRLFVRADNQEDWRPIKTWTDQVAPGHQALLLEYQPGAVTDPVLYLGHFDYRLDVMYRDKVLDHKEQTYRFTSFMSWPASASRPVRPAAPRPAVSD